MGNQVNSGGRYEVDPKTGVRTLVEEPTKPHPEGAGARAADGSPVPPHGATDAEQAADAPAKAKKTRGDA